MILRAPDLFGFVKYSTTLKNEFPLIEIVEDKKETEFNLREIRRQRAIGLLVPYGLKFGIKALLYFWKEILGIY